MSETQFASRKQGFLLGSKKKFLFWEGKSASNIHFLCGWAEKHMIPQCFPVNVVMIRLVWLSQQSIS